METVRLRNESSQPSHLRAEMMIGLSYFCPADQFLLLELRHPLANVIIRRGAVYDEAPRCRDVAGFNPIMWDVELGSISPSGHPPAPRFSIQPISYMVIVIVPVVPGDHRCSKHVCCKLW